MSLTDQFKNGSVNFLKSHRLIMKEIAAADRFTRKAQGNQVFKFSMNGHIDFQIDAGSAADAANLGLKTLSIIPAAADAGVRALPWVSPDLTKAAAAGTYMKLDAAARWFFTGPIEGCFIYIATRPTGEVYVFHVNANGLTGVANTTAKDSLVRPILAAKGLTLHQRLAHSDYSQLGSTCKGFVYGWKLAGQWRFHVHSLRMVGKTTQVTPTYSTFTPKKFEKHIASTVLPAQGAL